MRGADNLVISVYSCHVITCFRLRVSSSRYINFMLGTLNIDSQYVYGIL